METYFVNFLFQASCAPVAADAALERQETISGRPPDYDGRMQLVQRDFSVARGLRGGIRVSVFRFLHLIQKERHLYTCYKLSSLDEDGALSE